ncbi:MAG: hypothetical protein B6I28_04345 [Fusobacteriia bacterium 4572_132]|nr:MAG: hypothetical protein B6I28_04345 [Fusobacteriia bacterium 4572_132]
MIKNIVILISLIIIFSGCSIKKKKEVVKEIPKPFYEQEMPILDENNIQKSDSLWGANQNSLFSDQKAKKIGDLVVIIIRENASATQTASNSKDKNGKLEGKPGTGLLNIIPELGAEGSSKLSSSGTTKRSGNLTAKVTARVIKKDNYGNLFLMGSRNVLINKELQEIKISGYARPEDIGLTNTIESSYLANAEVKYNGKIVFDGKTKPGMISKFLGSMVGFFF